jgi:hypothetical protein
MTCNNSSPAAGHHCLRNCHFESSEKSAFPAGTTADSLSHPLLGMTQAKGRTKFTVLRELTQQETKKIDGQRRSRRISTADEDRE